MIRASNFIVLFASLFVVSCNSKYSYLDSAEEIKEFVTNPEVGFIKEEQRNGLSFVAQLKPSEYLLSNENYSIQKDSVKAEIEKLNEELYFTFKIVNNEGIDPIKFNLRDEWELDERTSYYSFHAQNDFKLVFEGDSIPCSSFHLERTYGLSPELVFLMAFDRPLAGSDDIIELHFFDRVYGYGDLKFPFKMNVLTDFPDSKII